METIKRLSDVDPSDLPTVERLFGQRIDSTTGFVLILKSEDHPSTDIPAGSQDRLPDWCNVLEGMSDEDLADLDAAINEPVRLSRSLKNGS
jgi:hypothetical protein